MRLGCQNVPMRVVRGVAGTAVGLLASLAVGIGVAQAAATSITAVEGQPLTSVVVDNVSPCQSARSLQNITINWGDGSLPGPGTATSNGTTCDISGTHTYVEEGSYVTKISYTLVTGGTVTDTGAATVADAQIAASAVNDFNVSAGSTLAGAVANWTDPAPEALASYSAAIDWGDGTSSAGAIGSGTVGGSHTYANGGRFTITVTMHDEGGSSATAQEHAIVAGCSSPTAPGPPARFAPTVTGLDARFVQSLYHDVLGRVPAPAELTAATSALSLGVTRSQLALTLLDSNEYRADLIASDYRSYLHRTPTPAETQAQLPLLGSGGGAEVLAAQVFGSPEYFNSRGNGSNDGFLSALYCDVLSRSIDQVAQTLDDGALGSGAPRTAIASSALDSAEYRSHLITGFYQRYLGRAATPGEISHWTAFMSSGGTDEQVIAAIVSSQEYFARVNPAPAIPAVFILHGNTIQTTLTHTAALTLTVLRIGPLGHAAAVKVSSPRTKLVGVVNFGLHHAGKLRLRWDRTVRGHRLRRGSYLLILKAFSIHKPYRQPHKPYKKPHKPFVTGKLIGISDTVRITIR